MKHSSVLFSSLLALTLTTSGNTFAEEATYNKALSDTPAQNAADLAQYRSAKAIGQNHLENFDTLDFDVYSNQQWDRLKESHAKDIIVYYPDGSTTKGIPDHIKAMAPSFDYAPDTKVVAHPVRIASIDGEWTSVIGEVTGTFTKPMKLANGKVIQPTGKKFTYTMSTVGHWKDGLMDKEYLFWDNQSIMQKMGIKQ